MTEAESEIKWGCTSTKILFSAAMNFKMINKTQSVVSRHSLEFSKADKVMNKQKLEQLTWAGGCKRVGESQVAMWIRKMDSVTKQVGTIWVRALSHSQNCTHPVCPSAQSTEWKWSLTRDSELSLLPCHSLLHDLGWLTVPTPRPALYTTTTSTPLNPCSGKHILAAAHSRLAAS
jgi:hypothetical protein